MQKKKKIAAIVKQGKESSIANFWNNQINLTKTFAVGERLMLLNVVCNTYKCGLTLNTNEYTKIVKV